MRFRLSGVAVALIAGGCGTSEDVKRTGVVWQGTVAARYDQLAKCLSTQTTLYYKSALQFDSTQRRATVTFSVPVTGIPVEVYDIRQVSDEATEVSWSTRLERGRQQAGKPDYLLHVCGAAPVPSLPAPPSPAQPAPSTTAPASQAPNWAPEPETDGRGGR